MQQFWSSSHRWGIGVSRIATSIHLPSLASRSIRFAAPVVEWPTQRPKPGLGRSRWAGGAIPAGVRFVATWERIALDPPVVAGTIPCSPDRRVGCSRCAGACRLHPPVCRRCLQRPNAADPTGPDERRRSPGPNRGAHDHVAVPAPREAGRYLLDVKMLDSDGRSAAGRRTDRHPERRGPGVERPSGGIRPRAESRWHGGRRPDHEHRARRRSRLRQTGTRPRPVILTR